MEKTKPKEGKMTISIRETRERTSILIRETLSTTRERLSTTKRILSITKGILSTTRKILSTTRIPIRMRATGLIRADGRDRLPIESLKI